MILAKLMESQRYGGAFSAEGHRVDFNRDILVNAFLTATRKPEWMLMLDTDMQFPDDIAERLIRWNKPIVGALYFYRGQSHDPFAFTRIPDIVDKYDRTVPRWVGLRGQVFDFLKANNVPLIDGRYAIQDPKGNALLECDAVATGAMIIHRSVLETMEPPWFEYRTGGISEDLQFCMDAKEYGIPIYCDLSTICGHYAWQPMGHSQFMQLHENRGLHFSRFMDENSSIQVGKFLDIPEDKAEHWIIGSNGHVVGDYWRDRFGDRVPTPEEADTFYKETYTGKLYMQELLHYNATPGYLEIQKQFVPARKMVIYDIGSGLGTLGIQFMLQDNKVIMYEKNPLLRKWIKWRIDKLSYELKEKFDTYVTGKPFSMSGVVDLVTAIDVFEHIPLEELVELLHTIWNVLKPGGQLYFLANWGQQDLYPMHYSHKEEFTQALIDIGFKFMNESQVVKDVDR